MDGDFENLVHMMSSTRLALTFAALMVVGRLASPAPARAQDADRDEPQDQSTVERSAEAGMFLPLTMAPRTDSQRAFLLALGGYDSARRSGQFEAIADVTIIGPLALRIGTMYTGQPDQVRPSGGLRVQPLSQEDNFIDMSIGVFYKPEGFTEAEGEIEGVLAFGRQFGRLGTFANLVYGQDPEGRERDGEFRLAALYDFDARLQAGLDLRMRFDLGEEEGEEGEGEMRREGEAEYDFIAGPTASYELGPVAIVAMVGVSAVGLEPDSRAGAIALAGLAGSL